jgi:hypothetical protein
MSPLGKALRAVDLQARLRKEAHDAYYEALRADGIYQQELIRVYRKDACNRRYQMADHEDPRVQAARERFREATEIMLAAQARLRGAS